MSEFDLIKTYFHWDHVPANVRVGVGDDAAIVELAPHEELVISVDTAIAGVHFPTSTTAHAIAYKVLASNLSDLAAMGADPRWFTLALTLPQADADWLTAFARGLRELAQEHGIFLIGGDTTRGPLSITIQVMGTVPRGTALLRSGACPGDRIYVSGSLGDAAAGLAIVQQRLQLAPEQARGCVKRLDYPSPRLALGQYLRQRASACLDVSDGLLADLKHLLARSQVGARLEHAAIPLSPALRQLDPIQALQFALTGGDDYELLFSAPPTIIFPKELDIASELIPITPIGQITSEVGVVELDQPISFLTDGYNHFK